MLARTRKPCPCKHSKDTVSVSFSIQLKRKSPPGLPSHFYLSPDSFLHLQKIVVILSPDWRRIHHHIIRQLFPEPSGGLAPRRIIIQTKMNFFYLPVLLYIPFQRPWQFSFCHPGYAAQRQTRDRFPLFPLLLFHGQKGQRIHGRFKNPEGGYSGSVVKTKI